MANRQKRISFGFVVLTFVLVGWLHLATPLLAALFGYFVLTKLYFFKERSRWLAVALFLILLAGLAYGVAHFIHQTIDALPEIVDKAIPSVIAWAQQYQVKLPFTDFESLKTLATDTAKEQAHFLGQFANFARGATMQFVFLVVGCVVAVSLFLNGQIELDRHTHAIQHNLYSLCCDEIAQRFAALYQSFATVMGAQIVISAINTGLTGLFVLVAGMPHPIVIVGATFFCGLLPVVGNLISNTIIVLIGFTVSPTLALAALAFLVAVHKLEYFLNSKIIGARIRSPVWLTLLGLIIGEKLLGIPGMILAPVVLNYLKVEASKIEVKPAPISSTPPEHDDVPGSPKPPLKAEASGECLPEQGQ
ncbi:MAG: AI-2E family transporter [Verrucomicrobia bacterium]|nr:AI-2E family transporter [Verrucomicrobiota bacterium]